MGQASNQSVQYTTEQRGMIDSRRVRWNYGRHTGDQVCQDTNFDAALEDCELHVEWGDFVCKALNNVTS